MRKPIIAGNWKMNITPTEAVKLINDIKPLVAGSESEIVVCPAFICLPAAAQALAGSNIKLGSQNIHWEEKGAFTGEVSPAMLKDIGVEYVIIGHSERRQYFGETDETVNKRTLNALTHGFKPIVCIGESLEQRNAGIYEDIIKAQTQKAFKDVKNPTDVIIAYEPIWAIGTGLTASSEQAQSVIGFIRSQIKSLYSENEAQNLRILYGGSMNAKNASELMSMPDIDGGLIGGASLKAEDFSKIVNF